MLIKVLDVTVITDIIVIIYVLGSVPFVIVVFNACDIIPPASNPEISPLLTQSLAVITIVVATVIILVSIYPKIPPACLPEIAPLLIHVSAVPEQFKP